MNDSNRRIEHHAAIEATQDATPSYRDVPGAKAAPAVALVEGGGHELTNETQALLRFRLRAASMLLTTGFSAFLIWRLISGPPAGRADGYLLYFFAGVTASLALVTVKLCVRCPMTMRRLRISELVVFGLPALFFIALEQTNLGHCAEIGYLPNAGGVWFLLIFTYALFIPNSWRRAAVVLGTLCTLPVLALLVMAVSTPSVRSMLTVDYVTEMILMMVMAGITAVYGTYTIGSLRREAFEAKQLGQYRLGELIGKGGMGEVYLAEHQLLKRPCAVKLIRPERTGDPTALARFEREVRATARLSHWNTVEIYDYGRTEDGTFYYVMEYLPGLSLATLIERYGPLPPERVVHLLRQTCDGLREAHEIGLIHRDIKPGNLFAAERGGLYDVAKLLDFGLVKPLADRGGPQMTHEGTITGSPLFMAPEQATHEKEADARSDIYALGAVGYFLLTGQAPFNDPNPMKVLVAHVRDAVVPPSKLKPDVPADLEQVILRCLAKKPDDRYPDVTSLERALAGCNVADRWTQEDAAGWWREIGRDGSSPSDQETAYEFRPRPPSQVRDVPAALGRA